MLLPNARPTDTLRPMRGRAAGVLVLTCALGGCAVATATHSAQVAEQGQDYDRAVVEYTKVLRLDPNNRDAKIGLERAKLRASNDHFNRGRRLAATGKYEQALVEYELAAEMNPSNGEVDEQLRATRNQLRSKVAVAREGKTELEALVERTRDMPPL